MKSRIIVLCAATVFAVASAHAQQAQPQAGDRAAPQAQQAPDQPEIPTRTAAVEPAGRGPLHDDLHESGLPSG